MTDLLLELSQRPQLKGTVRALDLPVPMPTQLKRAPGGYLPRPLEGCAVGVSAPLSGATRAALERMGATLWSDAAPGAEERYDALVFDATRFETTAALDSLHGFFHERVRAVAESGRVVVIGRVVESARCAGEAAAQAALSGLVKSLAKELGKRGITAQLLRCAAGSSAATWEGALRFLLTPHSAYVSGQELSLEAALAHDDATGAVRFSRERVLEGRVALVTGAARGIGAATVRRLAAEGAHVVCLDLASSQEELAQVAASVGGDAITADLSAQQTGLRVAAFLRSRHGGVDVVVHNAGLTRDKTMQRMTPAQWAQVLEVNLRGVERIDAALDTYELWRAGGAEVVLSSIAGIAGNMGQSNYASAKAGLLGYSAWRARAMAARGVRVNAVAPGFIETRMTAAIPTAVREMGRRMNALGQGGEPRDVAEAITFLASPLASGVSGQVLRVCGGMWLGA